ncbi:MAG: MgtC/SapB family protein [Synechococcaceae cyanobacterium]|nr:MgtC/SapB family protein [Synechococcaceae cyanobacterium]
MPVLTPDLEALLRMGLAVLCGMAVGLNRAHHGDTPHPNRLRVHVLVGLSACLMVLAAGSDDQARSRAIQGVAAGVGFLGAGEILVPTRPSKQVPMEVRGLSSAASIWFTASLGVTVAASSPVLGLVALVLALITLSDRRLLGQDNPENQNRGANPSGRRHQLSTEKPTNHKGKNEAESEAEKQAERGVNSKHSRQR